MPNATPVQAVLHRASHYADAVEPLRSSVALYLECEQAALAAQQVQALVQAHLGAGQAEAAVAGMRQWVKLVDQDSQPQAAASLSSTGAGGADVGGDGGGGGGDGGDGGLPVGTAAPADPAAPPVVDAAGKAGSGLRECCAALAAWLDAHPGAVAEDAGALAAARALFDAAVEQRKAVRTKGGRKRAQSGQLVGAGTPASVPLERAVSTI
jgi:hypothetical protein